MNHSGLTITVRFTCRGCGLEKHPVVVRERAADEDIKHYVEEVVQAAVGFEHARVAPGCVSEHCDLLIPFNAGRVGAAVRQ